MGIEAAAPRNGCLRAFEANHDEQTRFSSGGTVHFRRIVARRQYTDAKVKHYRLKELTLEKSSAGLHCHPPARRSASDKLGDADRSRAQRCTLASTS